jgi:hypothetical protein
MTVPANGQVQGQTGPVMPETQTLFEALRQGETVKVKTAVNNGVDANSRDGDGNTLLMQAAVYSTAADLELHVSIEAVPADVCGDGDFDGQRAAEEIEDVGAMDGSLSGRWCSKTSVCSCWGAMIFRGMQKYRQLGI